MKILKALLIAIGLIVLASLFAAFTMWLSVINPFLCGCIVLLFLIIILTFGFYNMM